MLILWLGSCSNAHAMHPRGGWCVRRASPAARGKSPWGQAWHLSQQHFEGGSVEHLTNSSYASWLDQPASGGCSRDSRVMLVVQGAPGTHGWPPVAHLGCWYNPCFGHGLCKWVQNGQGGRQKCIALTSLRVVFQFWEKLKAPLNFLCLPGGSWHSRPLLWLSFSIYNKLILLLSLLKQHLSSLGRLLKRSWRHLESHTTFNPYICAFSSAELRVSGNTHTITSLYVWNDWLDTHVTGSCAN